MFLVCSFWFELVFHPHLLASFVVSAADWLLELLQYELHDPIKDCYEDVRRMVGRAIRNVTDTKQADLVFVSFQPSHL